MKTLKINIVACLLLAATLMLSACEPKHDKGDADLSKKKLKPELAEKMSKKFVADVEYLFALHDSLEYYKRLLKARDAQDSKTTEDDGAQSAMQGDMYSPKFELSVSSWYSKEELLTYIHESQSKADSLGYTLNGFRIYIGVFPDDDEFGEKRNFLTTFISPTGYSGTQQGAFLPALFRQTKGDLGGLEPLEYGGTGEPPSSTYPQN